MIKNRLYTYRKRIVLTIDRMQELRNLLLKHGDSIRYSVITSNNANIIFDSFDELCGFSNFGEDKISSLNLSCQNKNDYHSSIDIDFISEHFIYTDSVRCKYCFSSVDSESVLVNDLEKLLEKTAIFDKQYSICKYVSCVLFLLIGLYLILFPINGTPIYKAVSWPMLVAILFIFEFMARGLHFLFVKHFLNRLYPKVIFAWGEESKSYKRLENLRSNLFWGVIVALIISLVSGLVLELM